MILALLVAAAPLALDLSCPGQYEYLEATTGYANATDANGNWSSNPVILTKPVTRPGVATLEVQGPVAQIAFPDGQVHDLTNLTTDDRQIRATYKRPGFRARQVVFDRATGELSVKSGSKVTFAGTCAP